MTIVELCRRIRSVGGAILLLCFTALLVGCGTEQEFPDFTPLFAETSESEPEEASESSAVPFAEEIRLILPQDASPALYQSAYALGEALERQIGLPFYAVFDNTALTSVPGRFDLILGHAEHPDRVLWAYNLKQEDYLCAFGSRSGLIGGLTEETTLQAMAYFTEQFLPDATSERLAPTDRVFWHHGLYDRDEIWWNGTHWTDFCLVYDSSAEECLLPCALALRHRIAETSGYVTEIQTEQQYDGIKKKIVLALSETVEVGRAYLLCDEAGMTLTGKSAFEVSVAAEEFGNALLFDEDGDGTCDNTQSADRILVTEQNRFSLASVFALTSFKTPQEVIAVTRPILENKTDAVFLTSESESARTYLLQNLSSYTWEASKEEPSSPLVGRRDDTSTVQKSDEASILAVLQVGSARGGFLWVVAEEGAELPEVLYQTERPLLVMVFGKGSGTLSETDSRRLGHAVTESYEAGGETWTLNGYVSPGKLSVSMNLCEAKACCAAWTVVRIS